MPYSSCGAAVLVPDAIQIPHRQLVTERARFVLAMAALDLALPAQRPAYSAVRPGPFISGTTHRVLQLGQRPVVGELRRLFSSELSRCFA